MALTPFECLFLSDDKPSRTVSELYALLRDLAHDTKPLFEREWERGLDRKIPEKEWLTAYHYTGITYLSSRLQKKNYKIIAQWYRCPMKVNQMFPQVSNTCWRYKADLGMYLHVWWLCPKIQPLWAEVFSIYETAQSTSIPRTTEVALL